MDPIRYAIAGSAGRMGRTLIEAVQQDPEARLAAALEHSASPFIGRDAGELVGAPCGSDPRKVVSAVNKRTSGVV